MNQRPNGFEDLQGRVVKLEKQNFRLKQLGAAMLIIPVLLLTMGQAPSKKTVEANEFILKDDSGNVRARLSVNVPKGAAPGFPAAAQLVFFDEKGKQRASLDGGTSSGLAVLTLYDQQERDRADFMGGDAFVGPGLLLRDEQGHIGTRLKYGEVLAVDNVSTHEVAVADSIGNIRARLFVTEKHTGNVTPPRTSAPVPMTFSPTPTLALYDEKGNTRAMLNDSAINFANSQGHVSGSLGGGMLTIGDENSGALVAPGLVSVFDEQGFSAVLGVSNLETPGTGETQKTSAASLVLFHKNKNVLWKAP